MKWIVTTLFLLIANYLAGGQDEKAGLGEDHREKFEEELRWKLSAGGPSGETRIEVSGNQVLITLTGTEVLNDATAAFHAKDFGLLCFLLDIEARDAEH